MTRRKGEMTNRIAERQFPFAVEIEVPGRGLGQRLNDLHRWCGEIAGAGNFVARGRLEGARDFVLFRFKDPDAAAAFGRWVEGTATPSSPPNRTSN